MSIVYAYFVVKFAKMKQHICHISLGSNVSAAYIRLAKEHLLGLFPGIAFGPELCTAPIGMQHNFTPFTNQTAEFETILTEEELHSILKHLERKAGRTTEEAKKEIIKLDVDLVKYDTSILKPEDWQRLFNIQPNEL